MLIKGKTVAVLVSGATPNDELAPVLEELSREGAEIVIVAPDMDALESICLDAHRPVTAGMAVGAAREFWFDGVVILSGSEEFADNEVAIDFVAQFEVTRKPIAALGAGIRLLLATELAEGRHLAAPPELEAEVQRSGAVMALSPLFKEQRWHTGRGGEVAKSLAESMVCALQDVKLSARDMENPITD